MSIDLAKYWKRIGFATEAKADLETLTQLHYLHTISIPFENLTPFLSQEVLLDSISLSNKILDRSRGGYCFEHNHLFMEVLKSIGFKVKGLGARVLWNQAEDLITRRSHMLLMVDIADEKYLADVGFGGLTLTTPLLFECGLEQETTHETFKLERIESDYKLQARVKGEWKTLYRFDLQEQFPVDYELSNYYVSQHPSSIFRNNLIVAKPMAEGRLALSNDQFIRYPKTGEPIKTCLQSVEQIKSILCNEFSIPLNELNGLDARLSTLLNL